MKNAAIRINELAIAETTVDGGVVRPGKSVKAAGVVNSLNKINFQDGHVFVRLRHVWNNSFITVAAKPEPGDGDGIQLSWDEAESTLRKDISAYEYRGMFYTDSLEMVWVKAGLIAMDRQGITLAAPEGGEEVSKRHCRRFKCLEISAKLTQGNVCWQGKLKNYSAAGFAIAVSMGQIAANLKVNADVPVNVVLAHGAEVLFEATCRIVRASDTDLETTQIFAPLAANIRRLKRKQFRSIRQQLSPQPVLEFSHPFLGKIISLKAMDISGAGVSVLEDPANSLLMAGMVIPEMSINFTNNFKLQCRAQVLYSKLTEDGESVQVGLAFIAMDCENQLQLASILYQAKNERSYVGGAVDMDELWDFFFETGFVYPKKYLSIEEQKGKFKALYKRLYNGCPDITRHIIYRDKGSIYGHLSMFRYYRKTWLLHHHAAIKSSQHKAGLVILDHLLQHINEVHHLADAAMKYIACYFRPKNRFANRVFGGGVRSLQDHRKGSLDEFAYFHHDASQAQGLPSDWSLTRSTRADFIGLKSFYDEISGGLMLDCLDLGVEARDEEEINNSYRMKGLVRERKFYSLKNNDGRLAAMFILNLSDVGLNMSSLTDCIQAMVIDHGLVGSGTIRSALDVLSDNFAGKAPVLLFPKSYADDNGFSYENVYSLAVLDSNYMCKFLSFLTGLTKSTLRLAKK